MKLSALIASRSKLARQAVLAHTAEAWSTLHFFATRIAAHGLRGPVRVTQASPDEGAPWAQLSSEMLRPSVLAEHFTEEEVFDLAQALAFACDQDHADVCFELEELEDRFARPLLRTLARAGVELDVDTQSPPPRDHARG